MWFRIIRALGLLPPRATTAAAMLTVLWLLTMDAPALGGFADTARIAGLGLLLGIFGSWWVRHLSPAVSTGHWISRRDESSQRSGGVASWLDIGEYTSTWATRKKARVLRPTSFGRLTKSQLRRVPLTWYAVEVARAGWLPVGSRVWSSCEEVTLRFGGPRSGKSGSLACHILDAPGAVLVTTSRTDLLIQTEAARSLHGRVVVFNPAGLGTDVSNVKWSAIAGCDFYPVAQRRASDLLPQGRSEEGERWDAQARGLLAVLLHAAALIGGTVRTVQDWISMPDATAKGQILHALESSPQAGPLQAEVRSVFGMNERTLTSITFTLQPALRWLNNPNAAWCGDAHPDDDDLLDIASMISEGRDTIYLLGKDDDGSVTLVGALTAEIAHQVRVHAATQSHGRLDPPMTAVLDEAPLTCGPIPLEDWTADMGGRGFTLHIAAQSPAQLRQVWGHDQTEAILGNTATLMVFGGLKSADDLTSVSTLCGDRLMSLDADDTRPMPVMTPQQISALPVGTALVLRNQLRPVVGRAPLVWDRTPSRLQRLKTSLAQLLWRAGEAVYHVQRVADAEQRVSNRIEDHKPRQLSSSQLSRPDGHGPVAGGEG
jgi:type IV secretion system protein VirD4